MRRKIPKEFNKHKGPRPDWVHWAMLGPRDKFVFPSLSSFFNLSAVQGKVPEDWRAAEVVFIHNSALRAGPKSMYR